MLSSGVAVRVLQSLRRTTNTTVMMNTTMMENKGFELFLASVSFWKMYQKRKMSTGKQAKVKPLSEELLESLPPPIPEKDKEIAAAISRLHRKRKYENLYDLVTKIEKRIQLDEGGRGIKDILLPEGELFHAAIDIVQSNCIAILTGFPCLLDYDPPTETDGPLGALALAKSLLILGKKVIVLTDECNEEVLLACSSASNLFEYGANEENFSLESFPPIFSEKDDQRFGEIYSSIDCLISIERAGPNSQQKYLTMRKRDMTPILAPLEYLSLQNAPDGSSFILRQDIKTIGIGDGGNEVGMGKVYDRVIASKNIPNSKEIACVVSCNHLIVSSVSNWGGYALAGAIGLISLKQSLASQSVDNEPSGGDNNSPRSSSSATVVPLSHNVQEYRQFMVRKDFVNQTLSRFLPTNVEEINKCARIVGSGARDGVSGKLEMMVDGMEIEKSLELLDEFRELVKV